MKIYIFEFELLCCILFIYLNLKLNEEKWCQIMGYRNPYLDPYDHHLTSTTVTNDQEAYRKFPENKLLKLQLTKEREMRHDSKKT